MRKTFLVILSLFITYSLSAQEPVKQKEVGLIFYNLNNFGISYKTGTEKSMWRYSAMMASGENNFNEYSDSKTHSTHVDLGLDIGKEFRKGITDNLDLRYGTDLTFRYYNLKNKRSYENEKYDRERFSYGLNLVLGFNYKFENNIIIGAELHPNITYNTTETTVKSDSEDYKNFSEGFNYGFSNKSALISLGFRF